jgi:ribosome-binding factor A
MLKTNFRKDRITTVIHRELPAVLRDYIADPRLHNITITTVRLSKKLDYADIHITQLDSKVTEAETVNILRHAASRIRYGLSQQLTQFRRIPRLRFHYDYELVESIHLTSEIQRLTD